MHTGVVYSLCNSVYYNLEMCETLKSRALLCFYSIVSSKENEIFKYERKIPILNTIPILNLGT